MYNRRCGLWFGTMERMQWLPTPLSGAELATNSWEAGGTLLNGGGYQFGSWDSHKTHVFEWRESSSYQAAQLLNSYAQGSFGRGLIHFVLPTVYDKNILPARWADPGITAGYEGVSLIPGVEPTVTPTFTSSGASEIELSLPAHTTSYDMNGVPALTAQNIDYRSVFIPIPTGFTLFVGSVYTPATSGAVSVVPVGDTGIPDMGAVTALIPVEPSSNVLVNHKFAGGRGVRIALGSTSAGSGTLSVNSITARLVQNDQVVEPIAGFGLGPFGYGPFGGTKPPSQAQVERAPWVGGMGHSGSRFVAKPTMMLNNGIDGGQAGYAATFREVGDWVNR